MPDGARGEYEFGWLCYEWRMVNDNGVWDGVEPSEEELLHH